MGPSQVAGSWVSYRPCLVLRLEARPAAARVSHPSPWQRVTRPRACAPVACQGRRKEADDCTPTRVCTRLSRRAHCPIVCTRLSRRPSAAPRALQSFCIRLSKQCSSCLQPSPRAAPPSSPSRAGCPSPAPRPVRARRRGPAACRLPIGLASGSPHAPVRRGRAPGGAGGYGLAQGERTSERAAGGHGGDGRGRWKRRLIFLYVRLFFLYSC